MKQTLTISLGIVLMIAAGLLLGGWQAQNFPNGNGTGSGTVGNCTGAGLAYYAGAGTTTSCDTNITDNGSGRLLIPAGSGSAPSIALTTASGTGITFPAAGAVDMTGSGGSTFECSGASHYCELPNTSAFVWTNGGIGGTIDSGFSRDAAAVLDAGNGSNGDTTGKVKAAGYMSAGTKFTTNAGCGESAGTITGGATAGKITTSGSTSCSTVVTFGNSATAPNGWACQAVDLTTPADAHNPTVAPTSTTTVTITTGTIVANDVIQLGPCIAY